MKALWSITGGVVFAGAVASGAYNVATLLGHDTYRESATFAATTIASLDIDNDAGSVTVIVTDAASAANEIRLSAVISTGIRDTENRYEVVGDRLVVRASCPNFGSSWCDARYTLEVPADLDATIIGSNGRIVVSGLNGDVVIANDNGSVDVSDLAGSVRISTDNGRVTANAMRADDVELRTDNGSVRAQFDEAPTRVVARSDNGSIEVTIPDDGAGYATATATDNGSVTVDVRNEPGAARVIDAATDNGSIRVRYAS